MPYRRQGTRVQVQKDGRWRTLKDHKNVAKAKAHLRALQAGAEGGHGGRGDASGGSKGPRGRGSGGMGAGGVPG